MVTLKVNPREKEYPYIHAKGEGMKPNEIAEIMDITVHTACMYRGNILRNNRYTSSFPKISMRLVYRT